MTWQSHSYTLLSILAPIFDKNSSGIEECCHLHIKFLLFLFLQLLCFNFYIITLLPGGNSFRQPKNGVSTLTLVNILQMSWNWYMLFISDIAWTVLEMVYIRLMVCLQRHTKVFRYITVYGGKILKAYFNMFILQ